MYNDAEECVCVCVCKGGGGGVIVGNTHTPFFLGFCFIKTKSLKFSLHINSNSSISTQILQFNDVLKANFVYKICTHLKHKFGPRNQRNPGEIAS